MDSTQRVRAILSFIQVADGGSFAAAARAMGISAAAVSKNVANLEKALGVRLMNRTTRTLQLTDEGHAFLQHARGALDMLEAAVDTVTTAQTGPSGRVRISTSASFGRVHLLPLLPRLIARHPALAVEVDFDDRVIDLVRAGYDIAIRGGSIPDSSLIARPIFRMHTVLVASTRYLARMGVPTAPAALATHQLIARRFLNGRISPWHFRNAAGDVSSFDPSAQAALILSAPEAVAQAACADAGIACIGVHLAWPGLADGTLKVLLQPYHQPRSYEMSMHYPHRALIAPRVKAVLDYLQEEFARDALLHIDLARLQAFAA